MFLLVHSAVEHSAVIHASTWPISRRAAADGPPSAVSVGVDAFGRIDLRAWGEAVQAPAVAAACLQAANHEVGTIEPVSEAWDACREAGVPLFVDASAAVGWAPPADGDVIAASAHKWGGPAGVGVLVVRKGVRWREPGPRDAIREVSKRRPGRP